jgi:hypothetical protein
MGVVGVCMSAVAKFGTRSQSGAAASAPPLKQLSPSKWPRRGWMVHLEWLTGQDLKGRGAAAACSSQQRRIS